MSNLKVALSAACAVVVGWAFTASADIPASAYVQSGLVAQYDGIENAGIGVHDPQATEWVDLKGGIGNATLDSSVTSGLGWNSLALTNGVNCYPAKMPKTAANLFNTMAFSAEITVRPTRSKNRECFLGTYSSGNFTIEHNSSGYSTGNARFWYAGNPDEKSAFTILANEFATIQLSMSSATSRTIAKNGADFQSFTAKAAVITKDVDVTIGGDNSRKDMAFRGDYHSLRLYDRPLSQDEMRFNAAIDQCRFNGANPATLTWPDGYKYDEQTGQVCAKVALDFGSPCGTVKVGGAEVQPGWETWTVAGAASPLTFVAEPAAGYRLVRWESAGRTVGTSSEYVLDYGQKTTVKAVFAPANMTTGLYVQNGLVAQWDGIDNQGTGSHTDGATTWKDVSPAGLGGDLALGDSEAFEPDALFITAAPVHVTGPLGLTAMTLEFQFMRTSGTTSIRRYSRCRPPARYRARG